MSANYNDADVISIGVGVTRMRAPMVMASELSVLYMCGLLPDTYMLNTVLAEHLGLHLQMLLALCHYDDCYKLFLSPNVHFCPFHLWFVESLISYFTFERNN